MFKEINYNQWRLSIIFIRKKTVLSRLPTAARRRAGLQQLCTQKALKLMEENASLQVLKNRVKKNQPMGHVLNLRHLTNMLGIKTEILHFKFGDLQSVNK